ncbi:MAG: tetratricopeptide repeat protein [Planctomycetes bacterium]|nr:tetratricopeptide repeat protein [Planctomycetota bacterium]
MKKVIIPILTIIFLIGLITSSQQAKTDTKEDLRGKLAQGKQLCKPVIKNDPDGTARCYRDYEGALKLFREIVSYGLGQDVYGEAQLNVAKTLGKLGRTEEAVEEYRKLIRAVGALTSTRDSSPASMRLKDYRSQAQKEIAYLYFNNKQYKEALEAIVEAQKYPFGTGCGTCDIEIYLEDAEFTGRCYEKLGETDKAVDLYWKATRKSSFNMVRDIPLALTDIYIARGKVDEIKALAEAEAQKSKTSATKVILEYLEIVALKDKGDVEGLFKLIVETVNKRDRYLNMLYYRKDLSWKVVKAAEALGSLDDKAVGFISKKLLEPENRCAVFCAGFIQNKLILQPMLDSCPTANSRQTMRSSSFLEYSETFYSLKSLALPFFEEVLKTSKNEQERAKVAQIMGCFPRIEAGLE